MRIKKIYVAEDIPKGQPKKKNEDLDYGLLNTDVIVQLQNGHSYRANFITLKKLVNEFQGHQQQVEGLAKKYFWTKSMVIVNDMQKEELTPIIEYMIEEGDFQMIFEKLAK